MSRHIRVVTPEAAGPTRPGQLTDSSTGTSGGQTISAVTTVATAANGIATLAAKVNAIEDVLLDAGITSPTP